MTDFSPEASVERVGDTVRRPARPFSASVQAVLRHLRAEGVTSVPEPLGFDDQGREVVSFLAGDVWNDPIPELVWREATLMAAARLLRRIHDASAGFAPPGDARWMLAMPADLPVEVVCHNDFAPYNVVFDRDRVAGVIDWETAAPGARVWDLAYAAYRFVPLSLSAPPELLDVRVQARRLALFCDAYGAGDADRGRLLAAAERRVGELRGLTLERARGATSEAGARMWREHAELYAADIAYLRAEAAALRPGRCCGCGGRRSAGRRGA